MDTVVLGSSKPDGRPYVRCIAEIEKMFWSVGISQRLQLTYWQTDTKANAARVLRHSGKRTLVRLHTMF